MELWDAKTRQTTVRVLCAMAVLGWAESIWAGPTAGPLSASLQNALETADLVDANADSSALRVLSSAPAKAAADTSAASDTRAGAAQKSAQTASVGKRIPGPLNETLQTVAKELAVHTGAVNAKQYLGTELGLDTSTDAPVDASAEAGNALRRPSSGEAASRSNGEPPSAEQRKLNKEQASFLASALLLEVMPWAIGFAALLGCAQGLRVVLAFSRRQALRKRKHRKSSSGRTLRRIRR